MVCVNLVDELFAVAAALEAASIPYAVCGGIAVTIHGATRTTKDIDLLVSEDDVDAILDLVRPLGFRFAALPMTFDETSERPRRVQRVSKIDGQQHLVLDLLVADEGLARCLAERQQLRLPEGTLWVVTRECLMTMKREAGRPQDLADLERLENEDDQS